MKNKFYITTPIYYVNDVPHIGHICTTINADILARFHRLLGDNVFFLTGVDEHGQKIDEASQKAGYTSPQEYCDHIAPTFVDAWKSLNISYDHFFRTTDPRHIKIVSDILTQIYKNGDIYKGKYEGQYCLGCEKFLTESDLVDGKCPLHPPEKVSLKTEENWFFRLSKYVPDLIKLIKNDKTNYVFPEGKRKEILSKLKQGVTDISISRDSVNWGIPIPWDTTQTVYVWFDALLNYLTATEFLEKSEFWPADYHFLAKDISWFHTCIWQAMLLSIKKTLPKNVFVHSFYLVDGQKMSKSLGNVIAPKQLLDIFGIDGTRYLIASTFPRDDDSDVGIQKFSEKYNADLANNLGNLVSRVASLAKAIPLANFSCEFDPTYSENLDNCNFTGCLKYIFDQWINPLNIKINQDQPWKLEKDDPVRVKILQNYISQIQKIAFHLKPFMPEFSTTIDNLFGDKVGELDKPIFKRL